MRWSWWVSLAVHGAILAGTAAAAGSGLVGPSAEPPVSIESAVIPERSLLTPRSHRDLFTMEIPDRPEPMPEAVLPPEPEPALSACSFESPTPVGVPLVDPELCEAVVTVAAPAAPVCPAAVPSAEELCVADALPREGNPRPGYPERAIRQGIEGRVLIRLHVSLDGTVVRVVIEESSGSRLLDAAAVGALRRWRFTPATRRGEPVAATVLVPVEFHIAERSSS